MESRQYSFTIRNFVATSATKLSKLIAGRYFFMANLLSGETIETIGDVVELVE
jgi:hypothetical protein